MTRTKHGIEYDRKFNAMYCSSTKGRFVRMVSEAKRLSKKRSKKKRQEGPDNSHECTIVYNDLLQAWEALSHKCAYSGIPMSTTVHADFLVSLERLNPQKGYTPLNCTLVCCEFNGGKQWSVAKVNVVKTFNSARRPVFSPPPLPNTRHTWKHADSGTFYNFVYKLYGAAKCNGKARDGTWPEFGIEWIVEQLVRQNGQCYYSGLPMVFVPKSEWQASLERIDPKIGYTKKNVVLICWEFNTGNAQWSREKIAYLRTVPPIHSEQTVLGKRERED